MDDLEFDHNLDETLAKYILPRLKVFREGVCSFPHWIKEVEWEDGEPVDNLDRWKFILDKMIFAFDYQVSFNTPEFRERWNLEDTPESWGASFDRMKEGLEWFAEAFGDLWN